MMLTRQARELLRGPNFAVIATINADGTPQQSVVWVAEHDGTVVFSTVEGRAKHRTWCATPGSACSCSTAPTATATARSAVSHDLTAPTPAR
jgi:pyridoxine/pyridoxamine 5'-phosphate oxidase